MYSIGHCCSYQDFCLLLLVTEIKGEKCNCAHHVGACFLRSCCHAEKQLWLCFSLYWYVCTYLKYVCNICLSTVKKSTILCKLNVLLKILYSLSFFFFFECVKVIYFHVSLQVRLAVLLWPLYFRASFICACAGLPFPCQSRPKIFWSPSWVWGFVSQG